LSSVCGVNSGKCFFRSKRKEIEGLANETEMKADTTVTAITNTTAITTAAQSAPFHCLSLANFSAVTPGLAGETQK